MGKYKINGISTKKKNNLLFMLLVIFLISVILCISSFGIATWARYRSVTGSNVEAQIAKWSFKVNGEEEQFADIDLADTIDFTHVTTDKIAPGTYGSFDLDIDGRGSEVSLDYYIDMVVTSKPTNMIFYSDANYSQPIELAVGNKMFLEGDLLLSENPMQEIRTIYWKWEYRTSTMPSTVVLNAYSSVIPDLETLVNDYNSANGNSQLQQEIAMKINDKIDTYEAGGQVIVNVKVKGVQINPNFSLKRVQVTSSKDDIYEAGDTVNFSMEFTENVYGNNNKGLVTSANAPEVTVGFGGTSANNPVAKVASLMQTNLKLSEGENLATFVSVNGNKINYSYTLKSGDSGAFRITNITGKVYNIDGKEIDFGTVQSVPEVIGGTVTTEAPVNIPINNPTVTPTGNVTPTPEPTATSTPTPTSTPIPTPTPTPTPTPSPVDLPIGNSIPFTTKLNNVNLNNWKVFYNDIDNGNVYLILNGALPNSAVNISGINKEGTYNVYADNRSTLVNAMTTKANWSQLVTNGKINGKNINLTASENIYGMGSPTLDLFIKSWNVQYPEKTLYSKRNSTGYFVGTSSNPSTYYVETGITDNLYFMSMQDYWLASLSAEATNCVMFVYQGGHVSCNYIYSTSTAFRPIVCLPASLFN